MHGGVEIEFWEYLLLIFYVGIVFVVYGQRQRARARKDPAYRYYVSGLMARILGGLLFVWIYYYYYDGAGDTFAYFQSSVALAELAKQDPGRYFEALFAGSSWENYRYYFNRETGFPVGFVYVDVRAFFLAKVVSPLTLISFNSIILTTAMVGTICYGGVWRLYITLTRYYPTLRGRLAFAVLFFPSSVFWGTGIMKDTFAFTALCWYISALDQLFFLKVDRVRNWVYVIIASVIMLAMKPYTFMAIFPASLLWLLYHRVQRIRNGFLRVVLLPAAMAALLMGSITVMSWLGDRLGKFSLDNALKTVIVLREDMLRTERYGANHFDLGEMEATWSSVLSKFPQAVFAGLFRPGMLDVRNVVILVAAIENTFLLLLALRIMIRTRGVFFLTLVRKNPLLQMCFVFAVGYAFMVAVSTPNFGALVRFKIPLLPLFVSGLFITDHILRRRMIETALGRRFRFEEFMNGDPARETGVVQVNGPGVVEGYSRGR